MRALLPTMSVCASLILGPAAFGGSTKVENVIGLMVAEPHWLVSANTIAAKLNHENDLRIVPMIGAGGVQIFQDMVALPGVDAAILSSDSLAYAASQDMLGGDSDKFTYVARLATLDVVLITKRNITNIKNLSGKRIATGPAQSAAFATGELIFNSLGIPFTRVAKQDDAAIDALASGQADAALILGTEISTAALSDGRFHVLSLQAPQNLSTVYQPAILTARDLPGLIIQKQSIETISTSLTLAVYDRPRDAAHQKSLNNFETMIFKSAAGDGNGNLAAEIPGWKRHADADKILGQNKFEKITITPTGGQP